MKLINTDFLVVNTDFDGLTSSILIFTDWPTWLIGLCGKKFTHFSQPSYFHAKAQIRTRSIFTQRRKDRTCVFRNLTRWKGKKSKGFWPTPSGSNIGNRHPSDCAPHPVRWSYSSVPIISFTSGIKIPRSFGIVFHKGLNRLESRQHDETNLQGIQILTAENLISSTRRDWQSKKTKTDAGHHSLGFRSLNWA